MYQFDKAYLFNTTMVLSQFFKHWSWYAVSLPIMLCVGYWYSLTTHPLYSVQASVMIREEAKGDNQETFLRELNFFTPKRMVENEVEVLRSFVLMRKVVEELGINILYYSKTKFRAQELYKESPITVVLETPKPILFEEELQIEVSSPQFIKLNGVKYPASQSVVTPYGQLRVTVAEKSQIDRQIIMVRAMPVSEAVQYYLSGLKILPLSKTSSVMQVIIEDQVPQKGEDIINQLIAEYNKSTVDDKNKSIANTLTFLKSRVTTVSREVGELEKSIELYKAAHGITDVSADARSLLERVQKNDVELNHATTQLSALMDIEEYVRDKIHKRDLSPATLGLSDPTLITLINRVTELELQRDNLALTTPESNPYVQVLDNQIQTTKGKIIETVSSLKKIVTTNHQKLVEANQRYEDLIRTVPGNERRLMNIARQQAVKNNIYTYLLQKQEEISLSNAAVSSGIRTIDPAHSNPVPIKPNKRLILLLFGSIGLLLPTIGLFIKNMISERVRARSDIDDTLEIPVMGEVAQIRHKNSILLTDNANSIGAEQIRILRTKLQSLNEVNNALALLITSSISGEGKSFLSINLCASLALIKQPTILLEMDFRKPDLHALLGMENTIGLSNYLDEQCELDEILRPIAGVPNGYIITCGVIPPNPSELLTTPRLKQLFYALRQRFAYIIVDAPPIGLVTDAEIIAPYVDASLYLIRYNITPKQSLREVQLLYQEKRLPKLNLILNSAEVPRAYNITYYKRRNPVHLN